MSNEAEAIRRARNCTKCGYNLYGLSREGSCPECGQAYKRRKQDAVPKNPRRQVAQLRRMHKRRQRDLRLLPLMWMIVIIGPIICYKTGASCGWWGFAIVLLIFTGLAHIAAIADCNDLRKRIEAIDHCGNRPE